MSVRSPYDVLGVAASDSGDRIRAAYLELARKHHPDAVGGSHERMQEINDAWAMLSDPDLRAGIDQALPGPAARDDDIAYSGDVDTDEHLGSGTPVVGVAKGVITFAPICFAAGVVVFVLGVVLQVASVVQVGLMVLLLSLIAFLMAPFLAMGASIQRATVASSTDIELDSEETQ